MVIRPVDAVDLIGDLAEENRSVVPAPNGPEFESFTSRHLQAIEDDHSPAPYHRAPLARPARTTLVIPARNEARNLAYVLQRLPDCIDEVILVDGRSSDVTKRMAESCYPSIRIINEPAPGKGEALRAGFAAATGDVIVAMDADGSMAPEEIPLYLSLLDHGFDFVKGSRFMGGGDSLDITTLRKLGNRVFVGMANVLFGAGFTDLCYGFFAFRKLFLDDLQLESIGFEIETEIVLRAHQRGLRMAEVPSVEMPRRVGQSNLRTIRDGRRVLQTLLALRYPTLGLGPQRPSGAPRLSA